MLLESLEALFDKFIEWGFWKRQLQDPEPEVGEVYDEPVIKCSEKRQWFLDIILSHVVQTFLFKFMIQTERRDVRDCRNRGQAVSCCPG